MSTKQPRILVPFTLVALVFAALSVIAYFAMSDVRLSVFFALSAILIHLDASLFHGNNLKGYWEEICITKGYAPSYDRQWDKWSLMSRLYHILMWVAIAAVVVFFWTGILARAPIAEMSGIKFMVLVVSLALFDGVLAVTIWLIFTDRTLPKRSVESTRQN